MKCNSVHVSDYSQLPPDCAVEMAMTIARNRYGERCLMTLKLEHLPRVLYCVECELQLLWSVQRHPAGLRFGEAWFILFSSPLQIPIRHPANWAVQEARGFVTSLVECSCIRSSRIPVRRFYFERPWYKWPESDSTPNIT